MDGLEQLAGFTADLLQKIDPPGSIEVHDYLTNGKQLLIGYFAGALQADGDGSGHDARFLRLLEGIQDLTLLGVHDSQAAVEGFGGLGRQLARLLEVFVEQVADSYGEHDEKECQTHYYL